MIYTEAEIKSLLNKTHDQISHGEGGGECSNCYPGVCSDYMEACVFLMKKTKKQSDLISILTQVLFLADAAINGRSYRGLTKKIKEAFALINRTGEA